MAADGSKLLFVPSGKAVQDTSERIAHGGLIFALLCRRHVSCIGI
jgi:hypothetical protein